MLPKEDVKAIRQKQQQENTFVPRLFNALGDDTRWKLFLLLQEHKDLCVTDLANILEVSVPAVSQQLRVLELSGLIHRQRMGQSMCYQIQSQNPFTRIVIKMIGLLRKVN